MKEVFSSQETLRNYLLGNVSEEEKNRIEIRFFLDDDYFQELLIAEYELMEEYLFNEEMPSEKKLKLERLFNSSPEYSKNLRFIKSLDSISNKSEWSNPAENTALRLWAQIREILLSLRDIKYEVIEEI